VIIGIYSVMAYTVSLRTHEMGVRVALGADRRDILRLVVGRGMLLVALGAGLGLLGSLALTRFLAHMVWGVSVRDPWTYGVVVIGIALTGLASCLSPARRATRVNPADALRFD
jgi:ABC-type antimicrobial peptide transport system permease subunit